MKCCVSTDVGTWTNWLTFEPDPDYTPDAGTGFFSRYRMRCNAEFYYVGKMPRIHIFCLFRVVASTREHFTIRKCTILYPILSYKLCYVVEPIGRHHVTQAPADSDVTAGRRLPCLRLVGSSYARKTGRSLSSEIGAIVESDANSAATFRSFGSRC